jgi:zona occludens toxin (predicted ATPase)
MMALVPHPSYSPDLAPCDFFLFPKMKSKLKVRRFDTVEDVQAENKKDFQDAFQKRQKRWDRCVRSQGTTSKVMVQQKIRLDVIVYF